MDVMVSLHANGCHVYQNNESPLFCTPPTEERSGDPGSPSDDDEEDAVSLSAAGIASCERNPIYNSEHVHFQNDETENFSINSPFSTSSYPESQPGRALQCDYGQLDRYPNMESTGGPLTSIHSFKYVSATEHNYPSDGEINKSHQATATLPMTTSTSLNVTEPKPARYIPSQSHITGYATSEDYEKIAPLRRTKTINRAKKPTAYKSAEKVVSDSSSESNLARSHSQRPRNRGAAPAKPFKRPRNIVSQRPPPVGKPSSDHTPRKPSTLAYNHSGSDDSTRKSNISTKKRPRPVTNMVAGHKRPNTKGGFLIDDSESEAEEYDNQIDDECDIYSRQAAPTPSFKGLPAGRGSVAKVSSPIPDGLRTEPSTTPFPTKQLNRNRLNILLGRNKNAQSTTKETLQASPAQRKIPRPSEPASAGRATAVPGNHHRTLTDLNAISRGANRDQGPATTPSMTEEMLALGRKSRAPELEQGVLKTDERTSQDLEVTGPPVILERRPDHGAARTKVVSKKSILAANIARGHPGGTANSRIAQASRSRGVLQATLDDARNVRSVAEPGSRARVSEEKRQNLNTKPSVTTRKPGSGAGQPNGSRSGPSTIETQVQRPSTTKRLGLSSAGRSTARAQITSTSAADNPQTQKKRPSTPLGAPIGGAGSPNLTASCVMPVSQKRKLHRISGGADDSTTLLKKPAVATACSSSRSGSNIQAKPKMDSSTNAAWDADHEMTPTPVRTVPKPGASSPMPISRSPAPRNQVYPAPSARVRHPPFKQKEQHASIPSNERNIPPSTLKLAGSAAANDSDSTTTKPTSTATCFTQNASRKPTVSVDVPTKSHTENSSKADDYASKSRAATPATPQAAKVKQSEKPSSTAAKPPFPQLTARLQHATASASTATRAEKNFEGSPPAVKTCTNSSKQEPPKPAVVPSRAQSVIATPITDSHKPNDPTLKVSRSGAISSTTAGTGPTPPSAARSQNTGATAPVQTAVHAGLSDQRAKAARNIKTSVEPLHIPKKPPITPQTVPTPPFPNTNFNTASSKSAIAANEEVLNLAQPSNVSKEAQPFFEYSVFQKIWSGEQSEDDAAATEITVRPFTNIEDANAQAKRLFQSSREQHSVNSIVESSHKCDDQSCSILAGTFSPFDYPTRKSYLKIWVQRNCVSKFANQTPQALKGTLFISNTSYILRLFKLITTSGSEDSDSEDSSDEEPRPCMRVYQPHARPEIYTTREAANRAARNLQIELSHEKEPTNVMTKTFQEKQLVELNAKVFALASVEDDGDGCWRSQFNACGLGGDSLELVVEKATICGPRNV
ncbi:hypothetical protein BDW02DRAFT_62130 [Decorospora gaudefroyi]|uniref:Uncharacterized protein n=1 Tax=Decorospora gaudefroyi TaxID=184978 RepID=A0A6A5K995_9PLEO|nr:hypothetical protein BDW02DRAFT_62130 [Decorospora gaudefroyi]